MNWFKDKNNLPKVIAIFVAIAVMVVVAILLVPKMSAPPTADTSTSVATPPATVAPLVSSAPPATESTTTVSPAAAPAGSLRNPMFRAGAGRVGARGKRPYAGRAQQTAVAGATPAASDTKTASAAGANVDDVAKTPDPFRLPPIQGAPTQVRTASELPPVPNIMLTNWRPPAPPKPAPVQLPGGASPADAGPRRMAGVLFGDGVFAILETSGQDQAVQPGDTVDGGKVVSIEADHLTIKTDDDRMISVPLSSTPTASQGPANYGPAAPGVPGGAPTYGLGNNNPGSNI
jgi:hypothetical protein